MHCGLKDSFVIRAVCLRTDESEIEDRHKFDTKYLLYLKYGLMLISVFMLRKHTYATLVDKNSNTFF